MAKLRETIIFPVGTAWWAVSPPGLVPPRSARPDSFAALADYGAFRGTPKDAWGHPLTLICPGAEPGEAYRLISAGPDGIAGGLDRIE